jgi:hypothetical protein
MLLTAPGATRANRNAADRTPCVCGVLPPRRRLQGFGAEEEIRAYLVIVMLSVFVVAVAVLA